MTGSPSFLLRFCALAWLTAVVMVLAGCQTSKNAPWLQGGSQPGPEATRPPSQATRTPATPGAVPGASLVPQYPFPTSWPVAPAPMGIEQGTEQGAETASLPGPEPELPWPPFTPSLAQPPTNIQPETAARSTVPAPASGDVVRVALLLPLSGPNGRLGAEMLNAAQLAVFDFADKNLELLVHDTKGTPGGAVRAASAAIGDGAAMILGPLLSATTRAITPQARAAAVPVVAFSSDRSVAGGGIYTMGFLPSAEIERIVSFARSKGVRRFAVLAPDNVYGETVVGAFENAVAANGAVVVRVQFYDPYADDFSAAIRALAQYGSRRQTLLAQRQELKGRDDEVSRRALKRLERLQTIGNLPFDALLVADGGKRLQSIAALLPFYDIDPKKVRMLGTGQWDAPGIGAEPALIGGWFAAPSPMARGDFENAYRSVYGHPPPRLATLAYDGTALAAVLAQGENGPDFSPAAITQPSGFWGRDGIFRFLPEGVAQRGLAVMKVGRGNPEIISRAPDTFQAAVN